jgi:predicted alpha-1,6-mannanase (GH76 family)
MAMIGDLATFQPSYKATAEKIFANSVVKAANGGNGKDFSGKFYDDMGWWALAWTKAYDVTGNSTYLKTAETIFEKLLTGLNTTCGGIWWSTDRAQIATISDELYLAAAAQLANRVPANKKDYYKSYAMTQWKWFKNSTLIGPNYLVCDGLSHKGPNPSCQSGAPNCTTLTYTQGVILGALVELNKLDHNLEYLPLASKIANAAISKLVRPNGIFTDNDTTPTQDQAQFKGAFVRNLMLLHQVQPEDSFVRFFKKNADSIWANDRNATDGLLGPNWEGPFLNESITRHDNSDMPSQNSAISCLLAAHVAVGS